MGEASYFLRQVELYFRACSAAVCSKSAVAQGKIGLGFPRRRSVGLVGHGDDVVPGWLLRFYLLSPQIYMLLLLFQWLYQRWNPRSKH